MRPNLFFTELEDKKFFNHQKGTAKIKHNFKSFFKIFSW